MKQQLKQFSFMLLAFFSDWAKQKVEEIWQEKRAEKEKKAQKDTATDD